MQTPDDTAAAAAGRPARRLYVSLMRLTDKGVAELAGSPDRNFIANNSRRNST